jgi:hypothetical protein
VKWKFGLATVILLAIMATFQLGLDVYSMQETILILLLVAAAVFVVLVFLITFVLFEEGARCGFVWLRTRISRTMSSSDSNIGSLETMDRPRPLK